MNNVNNRKLFRKSNAARNKLREAGGIMASDAELMQTVAQFQVGGPVLGGNLPQRPVTAYSGTAAQFRRLPRSVQQQVLEAENTNRGIAGALAQAGKYGSIPIELGYGAITGAYDLARRGLQGVGLADPSVQEETRPLGLFGMFDEMQEKGAPLQNTYELEGMLAMQQGEVDPAIAKAVEQQKADQAARAESAALGESLGDYSLSEDQPFMMPGVTPSTMPEKKEVITPEAPATTMGDGAARDEGRAAMAATDPQIIAAKKGELGPKAQAAALINAGTQDEQRQSMQQLMKEFTENAPEYEGMDKGLAIAKIGFAMAAGKSPNAISNIASALEQGADMFIKDKRDRDAFNRQIQLSAMQYGMGEMAKYRAEDRLAAREGRKPTYWVAKEDMTFNGRKYKEGETVTVPTSYIQEKGIPSGLDLPAMAKAALDSNEAIQKALAKAAKDGIMKPEDYRKNSEAMTQAATDFSTSNKLGEILQAQIFSVAEGNVTGLSNVGADLMNRAASAAKVDLSKKFQSVAEYNAAMQKVANQLVNDLLGEGSKTMSDMDRRLAQEIVGYYGAGLFDYAFVDQDVLLDKLQGTLVEVENKNRRSLNTMRDIIDASEGYSFKSGKPVQYREALSVAGPYLSGDQQKSFGLTKVGEENGIPVYDFSK